MSLMAAKDGGLPSKALRECVVEWLFLDERNVKLCEVRVLKVGLRPGQAPSRWTCR